LKLAVADTSIHVIDFGSAAFEGEYHMPVVTTRLYRAPEVVLQLPWGHPCDMWSLGCMLFELYVGEAPLFSTDDDLEHLHMMENTLGQFPAAMVMGARQNSQLKGVPQYFDRRGAVRRPGRASELHRPRVRRRASVSQLKVDRDCRTLEAWVPTACEPTAQLLALLQSVLVLSPEGRMSAAAARCHPFCASFAAEQHAVYMERRNATWAAEAAEAATASGTGSTTA
jgi:serine/threonine protein kinase